MYSILRRIVQLAAGLVFAAAVCAEPAPLPLRDAVERALAANPGLAQIHARAEALAQAPPQAGSLPDPVIQLNALNFPVDTFNTGQEPMTQLQIGFSQAFPFPGKRPLREQAARYDAAAAGHNVEEARLQLVRDVRLAWWGLFYLDRALATVDKNLELLRQLMRIAETKYQVGKGLQQDVLLAQLEYSRLLDVQLQLRNARRNEEVRMNVLLDRPRAQTIVLPDETDAVLPQVPDEAALSARALGLRPLLSAQQARIEAAGERLALAKKDFLPDLRVGALYGERDGFTDFATLQLSISVPLYAATKQSKAVDQRNRERMEQEYAWSDQRNRIEAEISAAHADYRRAREQVGLFDTAILPQARQTVDSMRAGYRNNLVDFLNLVRAQVTLYNYEDRYWKALAEANQSLARLIAAVGEEIDHE